MLADATFQHNRGNSNSLKRSAVTLERRRAYQELRVEELKTELRHLEPQPWDEETQLYAEALEAELEREKRHLQILEDKVKVTHGKIELIYGPMFSGKTDELIRRIHRAKATGQKVQVFKHARDTRYGGATEIVSHDAIGVHAIPVAESGEIFNCIESDTTVVAIDEVQFFDRDIVEVCGLLANLGIRVILAGLNLDFRGEPFRLMPELLVRADDVTQLKAICKICGNPASRTQRLVDGRPASYYDSIVQVGGTEAYQARCRHCHEVPDRA